jgi:hypothetical protein
MLPRAFTGDDASETSPTSYRSREMGRAQAHLTTPFHAFIAAIICIVLRSRKPASGFALDRAPRHAIGMDNPRAAVVPQPLRFQAPPAKAAGLFFYGAASELLANAAPALAAST